MEAGLSNVGNQNINKMPYSKTYNNSVIRPGSIQYFQADIHDVADPIWYCVPSFSKFYLRLWDTAFHRI